jgi:hypothetical protein
MLTIFFYFVFKGQNKITGSLCNMAHLTEPELKALFVENLNECKQLKLRYYSKVLNVGLLTGLVVAVGAFLYFRYKGRMQPEVKKARAESDRIYILNKLKMVHSGRPSSMAF